MAQLRNNCGKETLELPTTSVKDWIQFSTKKSEYYDGYWTQLVPLQDLDKTWLRVRKLFKEEKLGEVFAIKVRTTVDEFNRYGNYPIHYLCGPIYKKEKIINIGELIIRKMKPTTKYIRYKPNYQLVGTNAYDYRLTVKKLSNNNKITNYFTKI